MAPSPPKFQAGTLVWVEADKIDLSQDEVGEVVSSSCYDYEDPRTGETSQDGILIKLKISNTRGVFPTKRLRLFEEEMMNENPTDDTTTQVLPVQQQRRRSTRTSSRVVTPSPTSSMEDASAKLQHITLETETEAKVQGTGRDTLKRKPTTTSKKKIKKSNTVTNKTKTKVATVTVTKKPKKTSTDSLSKKSNAVADEIISNSTVDEEKKTEDDELLINLKAAPSARKRKPAAKKSSVKNRQERDSLFLVASESDSDDEKDRPFRVEYASTGRSTCKSCDEKIGKNCIRAASRPLFRGKPGFLMYRHLRCQTFPEEITKINEVGGWRRLKPEDRILLEKQLVESKLRIEEENQELDADELIQTAFQGKLREAPPGLDASLLPFQREGVSWMYNQEKSEVAGGILADEMGMGKTLETITTILDNRPKLQHVKPGIKHPPSTPDLEERLREELLWNDALKCCHHDLKMADVPEQVLVTKKKKGIDPVGVRAGTLVICPLIALYQWKEEIEKFTQPNTLTICTYHGHDRHKKFPREILSKYDIVLTTYQVLEADFRKMVSMICGIVRQNVNRENRPMDRQENTPTHRFDLLINCECYLSLFLHLTFSFSWFEIIVMQVSPNKVKCPNCGRGFKMDKLSVHLKYFCGETAQRTAAQSRQRRSSDHPQQRGGKRKAAAINSKKKKSFNRTEIKKSSLKKRKTSKTTKKVIHASPTKGYESDSDLSLPEDFDVTSKRPSRSAARTATKRLSASSKDWIGADTSDSDEFSGDNQPSSDDESSDGNSASIYTTIATNARSKAANSDIDESSFDSDSESEDRIALIRSRKRQEIALSMVKQSMKKGSILNKIEKNSRGKASGRKKKFGKKPAPDESSDNNDDDPLHGIDMEELKEKAMQGCRPSVLHTISWWRIVLDEAHNIK